MNYYRYDNDILEWNAVFEDETTAGRYDVPWVRPPKKPKEPELQVGDSSALEAFLEGFAGA